MYLKSIEMHGFKSFAGRFVLSFNEGITGIVGPNGSGKSNVSDAVRWVLGEQSAKTLRGANMQDVIFSGTESRKALSFAYVCLTLDNSDHILPLDYDEVSISRRIYRSGESEYQINKVNCRLKDVQELFYDTGIGKEGYSIIGQGQIERILSSKPEERREIFDEAVGIVKYKKRKEASLKRLKEEEDNLARIEDVLGELTDRIDPLKSQADIAREFLTIKERQRALDINLFLLEEENTERETEELNKQKSDLSAGIDELNKEEKRLESQFEEFSRELGEIDEKIRVLRNREREVSDKKGDMASKIKILEERINSGFNLMETLSEREKSIEVQLADNKEELGKYKTKHEKDSKVLETATEKLRSAIKYSNDLNEEIKNLTTKTEELNKSLLSLKDNRLEVISEKQKYETRIEQINIQKATLTQRQLEHGTQLENLSNNLNSLKEEFFSLSDEYEAVKAEEESCQARANSFEDKMEDTRNAIEEAGKTLVSLRTRRETIKNIAERYEGYGGAVRNIMERQQSFPGVVDVVANLFFTDKKYETAIETALGGALQNIVTRDEKSAGECIDFLKKNRHGRVTFLPVTSVKPHEEFKYKEALNEEGAIALASELITCDSDFIDIGEFLLGRILVCTDYNFALKIAKKYKYRLNIVTLEGEQLRPGGSVTGGSYRNSSNLMGRTRELDELLSNIRDIEENIEGYSKKLEEYQIARDLAEKELKEKIKKREEGAIILNTKSIALKQIETELSSLAQKKEDRINERADLEKSAAELLVKKEEISIILESTLNQEEEINESITELSEKIDENTYLLDTATRNLNEIQIEEANAKSETSFSSQNMERLKLEINRLEDELKGIGEKKEEILRERGENTREIENIKNNIVESDTSFKQLLADIEEVQMLRDEKQKENKSFLLEKDRISKELGNLEKEGIRLEAKIEHINEAKTQRADRIWEEYELTYHNAMAYRKEDMSDRDRMSRELSEIASRLRNMGPVNTAAIEEYANVSERYEFLTSQCEDLKEARERLLDIIDDLNVQMQDKFKEGFAEISREFDRVFKELFGGGEGKLVLSDEKDLLESGISIIAQPPGKKLSNMMQLSGGEKSLTAIAILFAILNLKPSPFCLLDEIEAALDEQNVDRFSKYLGKLTDNTQFIIITHRRGTMNAADRLYGITMQEKGISTLVSVSLIEDELE